VLARVDLHFQVQLGVGRSFRSEPEDEMDRMTGAVAMEVAEPRQRLANRVDRRANPLRADLHQVDILRVAQRLSEQQLVDCGAAAKGDPAFQLRRVEEIAERAADDQVLLDLPQIRPRRARAPLLKVSARNQASTSTRSLMSNIHLGFFSCDEASEATSGFAAGSSGFNDFASRANGSSAFA